MLLDQYSIESFRVIRPNLLEVAWFGNILCISIEIANLVYFYSFLKKMKNRSILGCNMLGSCYSR